MESKTANNLAVNVRHPGELALVGVYRVIGSSGLTGLV